MLNKAIFFYKENKVKILKIFTYLFFDGLNKGLPFILMAFIALKLSPEQLGIYSTKTIIFVFLNAFIGMGLSSQLIVSLKKEKENIQTVILSILIVLLFNFLVIICIGIIVEFNGISMNKIEFYSISIASLSFTVIQIQLSIYQAEFKARSFGLLNFILSILMSSCIYWFVIINDSQDGVWFYIALSYLLVAVFIFIKLIINNHDFSFQTLKKFYLLGVYQLPHLLSNWVKLGFDRLVLLKFLGASQLGIYSLYLQFGLIVSTILQSLNKYWSVYIIQILSEKAERKTVRNKIIQFCFFSLLIATVISTISYFVVINYFPPLYEGDAYLIFIIAFAYAFQGWYFSIVNIIFYIEKTYLLNIASISSSIFHIMFSYYFIGILGMGFEWVAVSLLLSWLFNFIITYFVVLQHEKRIYD